MLRQPARGDGDHERRRGGHGSVVRLVRLRDRLPEFRAGASGLRIARPARGTRAPKALRTSRRRVRFSARGLRRTTAASGGRRSRTITRTRPCAWPLGTRITPARTRGTECSPKSRRTGRRAPAAGSADASVAQSRDRGRRRGGGGASSQLELRLRVPGSFRRQARPGSAWRTSARSRGRSRSAWPTAARSSHSRTRATGSRRTSASSPSRCRRRSSRSATCARTTRSTASSARSAARSTAASTCSSTRSPTQPRVSRAASPTPARPRGGTRHQRLLARRRRRREPLMDARGAAIS